MQFYCVDFNLFLGIVDNLKSVFERYLKVSLFIVWNEKGELRCYYIIGVFNKVFGSFNKIRRFVRDYFKKQVLKCYWKV